jgi:hypothetical protein
MSKHHHRDRDHCGERYDHEQRCQERMYLAYPVGSMPETGSDPNYTMPTDRVDAQQFGGSCYMTPTGRVCPAPGGGSSCFMSPTGPVCPGTAPGSCYMTPEGMVCRTPRYGRR